MRQFPRNRGWDDFEVIQSCDREDKQGADDAAQQEGIQEFHSACVCKKKAIMTNHEYSAIFSQKTI